MFDEKHCSKSEQHWCSLGSCEMEKMKQKFTSIDNNFFNFFHKPNKYIKKSKIRLVEERFVQRIRIKYSKH